MDSSILAGRAEHGHLSSQAADAAVDIWFAQFQTGIIEQKACREIVASVHDHIVAADNFFCIGSVEEAVVADYLNVAVEFFQPFFCTFDFALSNLAFVLEDLALEVGFADCIGINKPQASDAGGA